VTTILIGVDDSARPEDAVAFARQLADATSGRVVVANAFPYSDVPSRASNLVYRAALKHDARQTVRRMSGLLEGIAPERIHTAVVANHSPAHALHDRPAPRGAPRRRRRTRHPPGAVARDRRTTRCRRAARRALRDDSRHSALTATTAALQARRMLARPLSAGTLAVIGMMGAVGVAPCSGAVASTWSSPQTLSKRPAAGTPTLAFDGHGSAMATWATAFGAGRRSASRPPSTAAFAPDRAAPDIGEEVVEGLPPAPVIDSSGHVIAIQQRKIRPACGLATIFTLTPRFGHANGTFAPARGGWTIFSHTEPPAVALAANRRGRTVVAWLQLQRDSRGRCVNREMVRAAVRQPDGAFGPAQTLARGASSGAVAASVGQHGEMLIAWRHGQKIETRSRSAHRAWGSPQRIPVGRVDSVATALDSDGAAYLIWTRTQPTSAPEAVRVVGTAVRGAHSKRFTTIILERGSWPNTLIDRPERRAVHLALSPSGALAAWTSWAGDHLQVLMATATGGRFGAAHATTPAGQDFALGDLATSTAGRPALALTSNASTTPSGPFVALGAADGSFGAPEVVGPGAPNIIGEALAFSPLTGQPTLVWTQLRSVLASARG